MVANNDSLELVQVVLANRRKLDELDRQRHDLLEREKAESYRITYDVYQPQIRELEAKRDREREALRAHTEAQESDISRQSTELMAVIKKVERILDFLKLDTTHSLDLTEIRTYRDMYLDDLGFLLDDRYLKIKLYIVGNRKPTNKFSLAAVGKCFFHEELLKLPRGYGVDIHYDWLSIEIVFKDGPTVAGLKEYLAKHKPNLLSYELKRYEEVKAAYEQAVQRYTVEDFTALLTDRCPKCGFFLSLFDSWARDANGSVTCPRDQTPMVKIMR